MAKKSQILSTVTEFLNVVRESALIPEHDLESLTARVSAEEFANPREMALKLIDDGQITSWQAKRLLTGISQLTLGKYVLQDQLDETRFARIFLARHDSLDRTIVIKAFHRALTRDASTKQSLMEECRRTGALDHRNLIHIYDVGEDRGRVFLVQEYSQSQHMGRYLETDGPLEVLQVVQLLSQAASGLGHIHEHGIIHGDLKPENVRLDEDGRVKLVGLGGQTLLPQFEEGTETKILPKEVANADDFSLKMLNGFTAPEMLSGDQPDTRSDVYSLGCVAYFLLTGQAPEAETLLATPDSDSISPNLAFSLTSQRQNLPKGLVRVIKKMTARLPSDRYRDASIVSEILQDLQDSLEDQSSIIVKGRSKAPPTSHSSVKTHDKTPPGQSSDRKLHLILIVVAASILLVIGGTSPWWFPFSKGETPSNDPEGHSQVIAKSVNGDLQTDDTTNKDDGHSSKTKSDHKSDSDNRLPKIGEPKKDQSKADEKTKNGGTTPPVKTVPKTDKPKEKEKGEEKDKTPDKKKTDPKTSPKTAPKKNPPTKKPPPPPPREPFRGLPSQVELPSPDSGTEPVVLGTVDLGPRELVFTNLLGGGEAIKGILAFEMVAADGGLATREWTINLAKGDDKNPIATIDIVDNKLRFRWHESAIGNRSAAAFANTVISFTSSGKVKNLILRKPILVPPLTVKLGKNSTTEKWRLAELPDHSVVHCVVTKMSKGFPKSLYDPGKDITLARQSLKIRMGEKPETSNFYLELAFKPSRTYVSVSLTPYYQPQLNAVPINSSRKPERVKLTSDALASLLNTGKIQQARLIQRLDTVKKLTASVDQIRVNGRPLNATQKKQQRTLLAQQKNLIDQDLQLIATQLTELNRVNDLQVAIGETGKVYLQIYAQVGNASVLLLETTDSAVKAE